MWVIIQTQREREGGRESTPSLIYVLLNPNVVMLHLYYAFKKKVITEIGIPQMVNFRLRLSLQRELSCWTQKLTQTDHGSSLPWLAFLC